jgi:von Willebrand factor type A domain
MSSEQMETSSDSNSKLLARGEMALKAIQLRRKAAEFEAVAAELEAAVELAKQGHDRPLVRWMEQYGQGEYATLGSSSMPPLTDIASNTSSPAVPSTSNVSVASLGTVPASPKVQTSPWSEMLAGAEARSLAGNLETAPPHIIDGSPAGLVTDTSPWTKEKSISKSIENPGNKSARRAESKKTEPTSLAAKGKSPSSKSTGKRNNSPTQSPDAAKKPEAERAAIERRKAVIKTVKSDEANQAKPQLRWAWLGSSWGSSLLVHVAVVIGLFFVTIQMAENKVMSISSASVEGPQVLMEEPMEFDAELPEELNEEMPAEAMPQLTTVAATSVSTALPESIAGELAAPEPSPTASNSLAKMVSVTGASSKLANVQFFGVQAEGNTFCYVVDSSGSMKRDGAFDAAKSELMRSLASMKPTQRFFVFFFSEEIDALTLDGKEPEKYPVYATPENIQKTLAWVQRIPIRGGKPPNDALDLAIEMQPDGIFLLFDGDTKVDVASHLQESNRSYDIISGTSVRVPIHTIGFYTQKFEALMKRIAEENSGTYRFVPKPVGTKPPK